MPRLARLLAGAMCLAASVAVAHPPTTAPATPFAGGLDGPEGLAFGKDGSLYVGEAHGDIRRIAPDGSATVVTNVGDPLAGITVMRDGRILACAFGANRVWVVDPVSGGAQIYANVTSPNFVVQGKRGQVLVSSTLANSIVDVTNGANVVVSTGYTFPNGLAIRKGYLYVAQTAANDVVRTRMTTGAAFGPLEVYATGLPLADGIAFDRPGNLFVVGFDTLFVVDRLTQAVTPVTDPLFDWPANVAFGTRTTYGTQTMFFANYGMMLGNGTTVVRVQTNHRGARLR